jgi:hypothetical protein
MIRFVFRFLGLLGLAAAFVFLVYDGARSIANRTVDLTTVDRIWNETYSRSPQDVLKPLLVPLANWLWDPATLTLLRAPVWVVLVVVASLLMLLGRKKRRLIGYARD